jgi:hypothetical protein
VGESVRLLATARPVVFPDSRRGEGNKTLPVSVHSTRECGTSAFTDASKGPGSPRAQTASVHRGRAAPLGAARCPLPQTARASGAPMAPAHDSPRAPQHAPTPDPHARPAHPTGSARTWPTHTHADEALNGPPTPPPPSISRTVARRVRRVGALTPPPTSGPAAASLTSSDPDGPAVSPLRSPARPRLARRVGCWREVGMEKEERVLCYGARQAPSRGSGAGPHSCAVSERSAGRKKTRAPTPHHGRDRRGPPAHGRAESLLHLPDRGPGGGVPGQGDDAAPAGGPAQRAQLERCVCFCVCFCPRARSCGTLSRI